MYLYKNIFISSATSKNILDSIINKKKINYKSADIKNFKDKINKLIEKYEKKRDLVKIVDYKYKIFWKIVEDLYGEKFYLKKRSQEKKEEKFNIIYSEFSKILKERRQISRLWNRCRNFYIYIFQI